MTDKDIRYINEKGIEKIKEHANDFLTKKLKIRLDNDGKQTPYRGHPVFVAQHATATCCRECMNKWYDIPVEKELDEHELKYFVDVIITFIEREINI